MFCSKNTECCEFTHEYLDRIHVSEFNKATLSRKKKKGGKEAAKFRCLRIAILSWNKFEWMLHVARSWEWIYSPKSFTCNVRATLHNFVYALIAHFAKRDISLARLQSFCRQWTRLAVFFFFFFFPRKFTTPVVFHDVNTVCLHLCVSAKRKQNARCSNVRWNEKVIRVIIVSCVSISYQETQTDLFRPR